MLYMYVPQTSMLYFHILVSDESQFDLPAALMGEAALVGWCTLFIRTVTKVAPPTALPDDMDERESNHWWKAKKWAYANLNRLFVRYSKGLNKPKVHAKLRILDTGTLARYRKVIHKTTPTSRNLSSLILPQRFLPTTYRRLRSGSPKLPG